MRAHTHALGGGVSLGCHREERAKGLMVHIPPQLASETLSATLATGLAIDDCTRGHGGQLDVRAPDATRNFPSRETLTRVAAALNDRSWISSILRR